MTGAYFNTTADGLAPVPEASGPWSPDMLHGRLLGGMAARALEAEFALVGLRAARLTVDLIRPAPMEPVTVSTALVRDGRRIRVADASLRCGGNEVAQARVVFLRVGDPPPGRSWQPPSWAPSDPEDLPQPQWGHEGPAPAWQIRIAGGGFGTAERNRVWTRDTVSLVDDETLTPFVRTALASDLASPLANGSDDGIHYINGDYTLALGRYPISDWIGLEVSQHIAATGIALGACTLYDLDGPFATSTTTALANPPLSNPPLSNPSRRDNR